MRPCATVLRKTLPCSMPGIRIVWVYSARPVTFSRASSRGSERPTCPPVVVVVVMGQVAPLPASACSEALPHCAAHIDANELALVGGRAADVGNALGLGGRGFPGTRERRVVHAGAGEHLLGALEADRLLGRGADDDACRLDVGAVGLERDRDPERRPVLGRAGGDLEIGGARLALRWDAQLGDQLVLRQHGLEIAGEQILDRDRAGAVRPDDRYAGAERDQHRRQVHVRIAVGEIAPDGRDVAHADVGEPPHRARDHRRGARDLGRALDHRQRRHGADDELAAGSDGDPRVLLAELAQADQSGRPEHARLHHQHQRGAAGDRPHRRVVGIEQCDGLAQRARLEQLERRHGAGSEAAPAKAARSRCANCRSISLALARSTGWPRLPSLPVSAASIS